mgnify:CR=1 FL=1
MQSIREVKNRIRAVRNVGQITKAMEVVAATKMRKTQRVLFSSRPYAFKALELLSRLTKDTSVRSPFLRQPTGPVLAVIIASDKGLTGAFNALVLRESARVLGEYASRGADIHVLAIGARAAQFAASSKYPVVHVSTNISDITSPIAVGHISAQILDGFLASSWGEVIVISTHFLTALTQEVRVRPLLPINPVAMMSTTKETLPEHGKYAHLEDVSTGVVEGEQEYIYEPSKDTLIDSLYRHLVSTELYHLVIEANASEHSARRVAMKTASDNAEELHASLTLEMNKARQATITGEIIEMSSTQAAMAQ